VSDPLLSVQDLAIEFRYRGEWVRVADGVNFEVERGQVMGIVGESGSGKSVTALAILGLIENLGGRVASGRIMFEGRDLRELGAAELQEVRGRQIGMIFQQPRRSLDPAFPVGRQIAATLRRHKSMSRAQANRRAVELLDQVHIPEPSRRARQYPHELSGGMCQRAMIALALSCSPSLLIADEPTTALDVTVQAHVLDLLREVQAETGITILFITHDLAVIAEICDVAAVMYAGQVVETGLIEDLYSRPRHPYTAGLLGAVPKIGIGRNLEAIDGAVPDPGHWPSGCHFHPRCAFATPECAAAAPELTPIDGGHTARCLRVEELDLTGIEVAAR
jgi:oligopeptide/dipeptide ABC transporter ATP-binding protein